MPRKPPTHCPQGHPYAGDNLYVDTRGRRLCRICRKVARDQYLESTDPALIKKFKQAYRIRHPERARRATINSKLKARYGITIEERDRMAEEQDGSCAICDRRSGNGDLVVDHDHASGRVRGLLCHNCNLSLGKFKDNPEWLKKALAYLAHHRTALAAQP